MSNKLTLCKLHRHISNAITTSGNDNIPHSNPTTTLNINEDVNTMEVDEEKESEECEENTSKPPAKEEFSCISRYSPYPIPRSESRCQASKQQDTLSSVTFIDVVNFLLVVQDLLQHNPQQQPEGQPQSVIILDTRENRLYQTSHVRRAFTTSCHTRMMTKRSIAFYAALDPRNPGHKKIYLYDHKTTKQDGQNILEGGSSNLAFFINYLIGLGNEVYVVDGGWWKLREYCQQNEAHGEVFESCFEKELVDRYTCSPTNLESASEDVLNAVASKITDFLWLGNERDARDLELLQRCHITHVINVTNDVANFFEKNTEHSLKYCRLHASDNHLQDLIQHFNKAFHFIESARSQGGRVFVHCWAGVSRSPSIVAAYLMQRENLTPTEALEMIRQKRSIIAPNFNFLGQLERFHKSLRQQENCLAAVATMLQIPNKTAAFNWLEREEQACKGEIHGLSPGAASEVFDGASSSSGYSSGLGESVGSMRSTASHVESVDEAIGDVGEDLQHSPQVSFLHTDMRQSVKARDRLFILPGGGLRSGFGSAPVSISTYNTDCGDSNNPFRSRLALFPPMLDLTSHEEDDGEKSDQGAHPPSSLSAPVVKAIDQQQSFEQLLTKDKLLARSLSVNGGKKSEEMVPASTASCGRRNLQGFEYCNIMQL